MLIRQVSYNLIELFPEGDLQCIVILSVGIVYFGCEFLNHFANRFWIQAVLLAILCASEDSSYVRKIEDHFY